MPNIGYWLDRKYAILQQQADATSRNAATNAQVGAASAALDLTRSRLLPAESAANIGQTQAQTNLLGEQAKVVVPESRARINSLNADAGLASANTGLVRDSLKTYSALPASLQAVMGAQYQLGDITPTTPYRSRFANPY